jgi:Phosphotransferase enzyme family
MTSSVLLPPVPYDRTSLRPSWSSLPPSFRRALQTRLGSPIASARVTGTGFTNGFAALLTTSSEGSFFVKAGPLDEPVSQWYAREAAITAVLPSLVPSARLLWSEKLEGFFVLCLEAIEGARVPAIPWVPAELSAALSALTAAYQTLSCPPPELLAVEPTTWASTIEGTLDKWRSAPPFAHPHAARLAELEAHFDAHTRSLTRLIHGDLRLDNIVLDSDSKAWICDWNFLSYGPPWFDTLSLLLSAEASGLDPDAFFWNHPTSAGVTPELLDGALAAFLGYYLSASVQPEVPVSPHIRSHQRYYASLTWRWLSRRLSLDPGRSVLALPPVAW